ncbi:hypothetical protein ACSMDY_12515 [Raoultella ornithinolytica]|uniref:hypothetical protein n=1 Tax=Raoultella ornithinolytica TaxID=54291 RepID=UPI003F198416
MIGYALVSFVGMVLISSSYGLVYMKLAKCFSVKINQAWKHRVARFIVLVISAIQGVSGICLYLGSCYMLYQAATFEPYVGAYGYTYTGQDDLLLAWILFASAMGISLIADIFKAIFILTFAD